MPYQIETKDGIVIRNIPDDIASDAPELKQRVASERAKLGGGSKPKTGMSGYFGPAEAILSLGSGAAGAIAGQIAGIGKTLTGGKFGTPEGIRQGQDVAGGVSSAMTYQPRTQLGQDIVSTVGALGSKLQGIGPTEAVAGGILAGPAIRQAASAARSVPIPSMLRNAEPEMVGIGAAETSIPRIRTERAQSLPVPINLTKGQAERTFAQQQFEREAAKNPSIGEPLRQRFAQQNQQIPQNLEFFADQTGAAAGSIRATGEIVTEAIAEKAKKVKGRIDAAYQAAREAGETQEPINVSPLIEYLETKRPQFINAGVLPSTLDELSAATKRTGGAVTIDALEEIRKAVGRAGDKDATNAHYAREIKKQIDSLTEGKGGEEYKYARRAREQYAKEFEDIGAIDRLISYKPGTKDRSIALEDVFSKSIMGGSLDDVRSIRKTLQTGGEKGNQAWRELQGATVNHIKEQIIKNSARDINGNPVVSPSEFNKIINELDKDGKLYFIFGKQGAQKLRDLRDTTLDVMTSPPGAINTSNTSSAILAALTGFIQNVPAIGTAFKEGAARYKDVKLGRQVGQALNFPK